MSTCPCPTAETRHAPAQLAPDIPSAAQSLQPGLCLPLLLTAACGAVPGTSTYGCGGLPEGVSCVSARDVYKLTNSGKPVVAIDGKATALDAPATDAAGPAPAADSAQPTATPPSRRRSRPIAARAAQPGVQSIALRPEDAGAMNVVPLRTPVARAADLDRPLGRRSRPAACAGLHLCRDRAAPLEHRREPARPRHAPQAAARPRRAPAHRRRLSATRRASPSCRMPPADPAPRRQARQRPPATAADRRRCRRNPLQQRHDRHAPTS